VTIAALLASALGGGIVAALLEAWFANVRAYETARLLTLGDLSAMHALSRGLSMLTQSLPPADVARLRFPTGAWTENRTRLATRINRRDPGLFGRLSGFFAVIEASPPSGPLTGESLKQLEELRSELTQATLSVVGESIVYGPRDAIKRYRKRRRRSKRNTGARTGAQVR
jgi:hypothetical protein